MKTNAIHKEDRERVERLFRQIFLEEKAIYTLWGSKPMSEIVIYEYDEDVIREYLESLSEEELSACRIVEKNDLPELWAKWKAFKQKPNFNRFFLVERNKRTDPDVRFVYFVNILKTAFVIQENYSLFRDVVGFDFSPLEVVLEFKDEDHSEFWKTLRNNRAAHLWGILFGFGRENAFAFQWKHFEKKEKSDRFLNSLATLHSEEYDTRKTKITLKNFDLPSFISFEKDDPVVVQYEKERAMIKKQYRGKNFLDETLRELTSK